MESIPFRKKSHKVFFNTGSFSIDMLKAKRLFISNVSLGLFFIFFFKGILFGFPSFSEVEFNKGKEFYAQGNYLEAKRKFEILCLDYPFNLNYTIFKLMLAKCKYNLKDYLEAEKDFEELISDFPESRFVPVCQLYLGNIYFLRKDYFTSAEKYILAYEQGKSKTKSLAFKSLIPLLEYGLDSDQLKKLSKKDFPKDILSEVYFFWGKKELKQKKLSSARGIFLNFKKNFPESPHLSEVQKFLSGSDLISGSTVLKIGILTPLSGEFSLYGQNLLNGIKLGIEKTYSETASPHIRLLTKDTESKPDKAAIKAKELIQEDVSVILGPLTSEESVGAGCVANCHGIPILLPTASFEDIAKIGEYVFQLALSPEKIGRGVAEYALKEMNLNYFAVLSPDDKYGTSVSEAFKLEVEKLGGKVVDVEYYSRGATDFGSNLSNLREILLEEKGIELDSSFFVDEDGKPIPRDALPLSLDGLFVPGYPEEVILIAPQVRFKKIQTKILGTDGWGEKEVLDLSKDYVEGVVFASEFSHLDYDPSFASFEKNYEKTYLKDPDKAAILGYKASLILSSVLKDDPDPQRIKTNLLKLEKSKKCFSVAFDSEGTNYLFYIYVIQNGEFKKLR